MVEVLVGPDVEALLVEWFNTKMTPPVSTKPPATRPAAFIVLHRTGGVRNFIIDQAQITIESWATKATTAMANMQLARGYFHSLDRETIGGDLYEFYAPQEFSGPANLPDPDSEMERYTETFSVGVRVTAIN